MRISLPELVCFDPGTTTGAITLAIDSKWLTGQLSPDWKDLGEAIEWAEPRQTGRLRAQWDHDREKVIRLPESADVLALIGLPSGPIESVPEREERMNIHDAFRILADSPDAAWVYEDFIPRELNKSRVFLAPVRVFSGILALEDYVGKGRRAFVQQPSLAMSTATDDRLRAAELYFEGMPHATDAARHATTFLRSARKTPAIRHQAWPRHFDKTGNEIT